VGIGALVGTVAALALAPLVRSMLFETSTYDFGVLAGVAGVLALVAAAASALPAWRASRVSPSITLQSE
jgi:putative ABC transport system permease protein